jgi:dipeptidyl aminopeptidase/acylaminoacyl peptidase
MTTRSATFLALFLLATPVGADEPARLLRPDDIFALKTVSDPQISPEGTWVAYTIRTLDAKEDRRDTDVWMSPMTPFASTSGSAAVRVTASPKPESRPRFSPDGRYLAFLSGREGDKSQVWLLDRRGGEAVKLTDYKSDVGDLAWSPDSKKLALIVGDVDPDNPDDPAAPGPDGKPKDGAAKTPKPIVIRRLQFKRDREGYLRELRSHLYVFDVAAKTSEQITSGPYDDEEPVWSPDGRWIAFASNRTAEPDANDNHDIFLIAPRAGETPKALTTSPGSDTAPSFSPDGKWITYVAGGAPEDIWYGTSAVAVVPVDGGPARQLTREVDRNVKSPRFTPDGKSILFLVDEGGTVHLARVPVAGGGAKAVERIVSGDREVESYSQGPHGELAVLESQPSYPAEISAVEPNGGLRRLTAVNDDFLRGIRLAKVQRLKVKSADGQEIDAFLTLPPDASTGPGKPRLPTILRIHGGPTDQYTLGFQAEWQMLAAHGYAVVTANPRGSSGYGRDFSRVLWADWGNKDYEDVNAAVDQVIAMGIADPERLGVGGWSYGGILTDYVITKTGRFKAAISGSSETNYLANYGTDHYQKEWEAELGLPWKNPQLWMRLSPFYQVEKITTPTLLLCGAIDVNVPCLNSEQLFQALRRLGRDTELVIYPDQFHSIEKPSYVKDRYERYLAWYDKHLKPAQTAPAGR